MKAQVKFWVYLLAALLVFSFVAFAEAETNEDKTLSPYFLVKSDDPNVDQLPLLFTSADVNIVGVIADVTVTQIYKNEGESPLEAIYVFPGSTRAAVYGMAMTIGDRMIVAEIQEKKQARRNYEQAKKQGKTASLLEQHRPNVFQMNVANILPGDKIQVELKYTELLVPTDGVYEFVYPTVVGPRYSEKRTSADAASSDTWVANPYTSADPEQEAESPYLFDITTNLATGIPLQDLSCDTHLVNIEYEDTSNASVTLDETEIIEKIRQMKPQHLERLKTALKELYIGDDFGDLPVFYQKLWHLVNEKPQTVVEHQEVKKFTGDRDYILRYRLAGGQIESGLLLSEGEDENFFLLMVQPPERVNLDDIPPREYIFIVDVSGSMNGFPLTISKTLLRNLISSLRPTDTFNVLLFAGKSHVMSDTSVPATEENIQRAINVIDRQQGGGGTRLLPALKRALNLPKTEGVARTVVIATDGYVDVELETFDLIRNNLNQANMFTFGIGTSVNRYLIEGMAKIGLGEAFVVTERNKAAEQAEKFREYIQSPVLTQIDCDFDNFKVYDVEPVSIPDVLAERPVIVYGKWRGKPEGTITLTGYSGEGSYQQTFNVGEIEPRETNAALRYLWARKRIELLGDYNTLRQSDKRVKEITQLGLTYNLLTKYTSFIAIDKVIRRTTDDLKTVKQALPLPKGVSPQAVRSAPEPDLPILLLIAALLLAFGLRPESSKKRRPKEHNREAL